MNQALTLVELFARVKSAVKAEFAYPLWLQAELSEVHEHAAGHCYLELIEHDGKAEQPVAKQKAMIWAKSYRMIKPYFESSTGQSLVPGMRLLVRCQVEVHELYGINLYIQDIDPTFTVGEQAMRRAEIVKRLEQEGVVDMNRLLPLPTLPQRVAVVSSASAAGYGDFCHQLDANAYGYHFHVELFAAAMQGAQTESSVIAALDAIACRMDDFDVVVIIRGGGATSDLAAFDNYNLALHCAQFPLPIVSGIGHQRDDTIVDMVAHSRVKTPTAAAEWLIEAMHEAETAVEQLFELLADRLRSRIEAERHANYRLAARFGAAARGVLAQETLALHRLSQSVKSQAEKELMTASQHIALLEKSVTASDPRRLLERGFAYVERQGRRITSAAMLEEADALRLYFADGTADAVVEHIVPNKAE